MEEWLTIQELFGKRHFFGSGVPVNLTENRIVQTALEILPEKAWHPVYSAYFADTRLTTPWIAWGPKWLVAGPVYTRLRFEYEVVEPPVMQTWSVDAPLDSKGAGLPFPPVVAAPVTTTAGPVVAGLLAGQTDAS